MRLRSVDVFRGVTMAAMVIVNNPGDWSTVYAPLLHAGWHGWTPTDLIFPFFLFIVGVAIPLSSTGTGSLRGVIRRSVMIFGLGLFLAGFPFFNLATWRIPGVLQRIAVCYLATVLIVRVTTPRGGDTRPHIHRLAAIALGILVSYAVLLLWIPVPGGHAGDLTAEGNLGAWLDRLLMDGHLWRPQWDPEGLLSTLPAVATTLMGVMAGLERYRTSTVAQWRWHLAAAGVACTLAGALWDLSFPINKSLWTSSYVLFTGGVAAIALALCSAWTDESATRSEGGSKDPPLRENTISPGHAEAWPSDSLVRRTSEPFVALGRNAILLFVLSGLIGRLLGVIVVDQTAKLTLKGWLYDSFFVPLAADPRNASLLFAIANLVVLYALLAWLHRRQLYWRV